MLFRGRKIKRPLLFLPYFGGNAGGNASQFCSTMLHFFRGSFLKSPKNTVVLGIYKMRKAKRGRLPGEPRRRERRIVRGDISLLGENATAHPLRLHFAALRYRSAVARCPHVAMAPFRKRSRSDFLLTCKRVRDENLSLPTFCEQVRCQHSYQRKTTVF